MFPAEFRKKIDSRHSCGAKNCGITGCGVSVRRNPPLIRVGPRSADLFSGRHRSHGNRFLSLLRLPRTRSRSVFFAFSSASSIPGGCPYVSRSPLVFFRAAARPSSAVCSRAVRVLPRTSRVQPYFCTFSSVGEVRAHAAFGEEDDARVSGR